MNRLKRSLSLRSSKRHIPESVRPQIWENDSYKVRNGGVSFPVKVFIWRLPLFVFVRVFLRSKYRRTQAWRVKRWKSYPQLTWKHIVVLVRWIHRGVRIERNSSLRRGIQKDERGIKLSLFLTIFAEFHGAEARSSAEAPCDCIVSDLIKNRRCGFRSYDKQGVIH